MSIRVDYTQQAEAAPLQAMSALSGYLHTTDTAPALRQLMELRASQINGCAYCVDMHTKELLTLGEEPLRIDLLPVWHEADVYTPAERAALAWTEALTRLQSGDDLDPAYTELARHFPAATILQLTFTVIAINSWNLLNVVCGMPAGNYRPGEHEPRLKAALERLTGHASA
ncbi:MAG: carboxymuconolactone decarboxylase family protein [Ectothiorhodospiraceae bacterium]|nr:carboxymuconolactone decarboxylase family protein [Ectothiorhodospiraceae bacterium]